MSAIDGLITNRDSNAKYTAVDLNRVGAAVAYLAARLNGELGFNLQPTAKQDWAVGDHQQVSQLAAYIADVRAIKAALEASPDVPTSTAKMYWYDANNIEQMLKNTDALADVIPYAMWHSGMVSCAGQGGVIA